MGTRLIKANIPSNILSIFKRVETDRGAFSVSRIGSGQSALSLSRYRYSSAVLSVSKSRFHRRPNRMHI